MNYENKFGNKPQYLLRIPQGYLSYGFNPQTTDIVIFVNLQQTQSFSNLGWEQYQFRSAVLQVERRPIYAFFNLQYASDLTGQDKITFHWNIKRTVHHLFHVFAFNTMYFLSDPSIDVSEIEINQQTDTTFFVNPYSSQRKKQTHVIARNQNVENQIMIVLPKIRSFLFNFYQCSGKIDPQKIGMPLKNNQNEQKLTLQNHFSINYIIRDEIMQSDNQQDYNRLVYVFRKYGISQLSLLLLEQSGFYERININQKTKDYFFKPRPQDLRQNSSVMRFYQTTHDICTMSALNFGYNDCQLGLNRYISCDPEGIQMISIVPYNQFFPQENLCTYAVLSCPNLLSEYNRCLSISQQLDFVSSYAKRDFNLSYGDLDLICKRAECFQQNGTTYIRFRFGGDVYIGCGTQDQQFFTIYPGVKLHCPQNKQAFCQSKVCKNWCSQSGFCVNGNCLIPDSDPQLNGNYLKDYFSFVADCYDPFSGQTYLCNGGCLICSCENGLIKCLQPKAQSDIQIKNNIQTQLPCQDSKCLKCSHLIIYNKDNFCYECLNGYYLPEKKNQKVCFSCENSQSCSHCGGTGYGNSYCLNCLQNHYLDIYLQCQKCSVQNCFQCVQLTAGKIKCLKCLKGYHLQQNGQTQCLKCLPYCGKCNQKDFRLCEGCFDGYFLQFNPQKNANQCVKCSQNCLLCANTTFCDKCVATFKLSTKFNELVNQFQQLCTIVCEVPCLTCNPSNVSQCYSCYNGYQYDQKQKNCLIPQNISCREPTQDCRQVNCPIRHGIVESQDHFFFCVKCDYKNCLFCHFYPKFNQVRCTQCKPGYYRNNYLTECYKCPDQCATCNDRNTCFDCAQGYAHPKSIDGSVFRQKCSPCTHNCKTCSGAPHQCLTCNSGFAKIGLKCVPSKFQLNFSITLDATNQQSQSLILNKQYNSLITAVLYNLQIKIYVEYLLLSFENSHKTLNVHIGSQDDRLITKIDQILNTQRDSVNDLINRNSQISTSNVNDYLNVPEKCLLYLLFDEKGQLMKQVKVSTDQTYIIEKFQYKIQTTDQGCREYIQAYKLRSQQQQEQLPNVTLPYIIIGIIVLLFVIIVTTVYCVMKGKVRKITLKFEEIKSKQQYEPTSTLSSSKQAF